MSDHPTPAPSPVDRRKAEAQAVAAEFPGWESWYGIDSLYHARIKGAIPPVLVRGEDPGDLRDEIIKCIRRRELAAGSASG